MIYELYTVLCIMYGNNIHNIYIYIYIYIVVTRYIGIWSSGVL